MALATADARSLIFGGNAPRQLLPHIHTTKKGPDLGPFLVISERLERSTGSLEGCCSIQLSYETIAYCGAKVAKNNPTTKPSSKKFHKEAPGCTTKEKGDHLVAFVTPTGLKPVTF